MLKVKYFNHPHIVNFLNEPPLATYGIIPWNDDVLIYFARFVCVEFFENMKSDYTDLPSKYYGVRKSQTYNQRGAFQDLASPRPPPPLISLRQRIVSLISYIEATY